MHLQWIYDALFKHWIIFGSDRSSRSLFVDLFIRPVQCQVRVRVREHSEGIQRAIRALTRPGVYQCQAQGLVSRPWPGSIQDRIRMCKTNKSKYLCLDYWHLDSGLLRSVQRKSALLTVRHLTSRLLSFVDYYYWHLNLDYWCLVRWSQSLCCQS